MQKITDYILINSIDPDDFTKYIKKALADGYQPLGSHNVVFDADDQSILITQAMVKYECDITCAETGIN